MCLFFLFLLRYCFSPLPSSLVCLCLLISLSCHQCNCHFSYLSNSVSALPGPLAQVEALKEENDSLRCQLDAYRNEVELLKQEQGKAQPQRSEEDATRQQQLSFLQQALQGMQKVHTHNQQGIQQNKSFS